ncbi:Variant-specific surface protein [Giardia duodenalis]|uniref:Variant-specific surface protein n=1 Tax=Giardia intestinalis TaxID=5741 RepID=V6U1C8_GIAIN|nr:Variant-specific surface protein [Giardia intestinalis]
MLMQSKHRRLPLEIRFYRTTNLDGVLLLLAIYFAVGALAADCKAAESGGTNVNDCAVGKCELIGEVEVCTECKQGKVPIDGVCKAPADATDKCQKAEGTAVDNQDTTCGKCLNAYFMYKGGCYSKDTAPGKTMCAQANAGICSQAVATKEYFVPPGADASYNSVVSCGDTAGVTFGSGSNTKTYKGVTGCAKCAAPDAITDTTGTKAATCIECAAGFLYTPTGGATSCVETCPERYFGHTDNSKKKTCQSCATPESLTPSVTGIPGCASCTYTGGDTSTLTCSECNEGKKPSLDGKSCNTCKDTNCASCSSEGACQKCASGYILDGAACTQQTCSTPDCKTCTNPKTASEACTACVSTHYLTPTNQCISDCAALSGYYGDADKTCKRCGVANCEACNAQGQCQTCINGFYKDSAGACQKCHESCKSCSGATKADCTACPSGKALKYDATGNKGTCGEGCVVNTAQASGNCKTCGLTVEGTKYCSECAMDTEYPQNGVCAGATGGRAITCTTLGTGVCTTCADGLLKMNGGCYETSRYPGKSVCTTVASSGGTCQIAADGYYLNSGTLVTCPEGCKTCSAADACSDCVDGYVLTNNVCTKCDASCLTCETEATKCTACASGYYLSGSTCTSCESNNGSVKGVRGCASCAAPSGSTGPVLCYLVRDSASVNKGGLSSGAIAGISIAVIAVVGGLVGFLCWWFVCRGKA